MRAHPQRPEEGIEPMRVELKMIRSWLLWALRTELGYPARAASALNGRAISLACYHIYFLREKKYHCTS